MANTTKYYMIILAFIAFTYPSIAQKHTKLYLQVDSIVRYQLHFDVDSAKADSVRRGHIIVRDAMSTMILYPLILLNGKIIQHQELDSYRYKTIKNIEVIHPGDAKFEAIYGSRAMVGAVIITSTQ